MIRYLYLAIRAFVRHRVLKIDDRSQLEIAISNGMKMGKECSVMENCIFDCSHCWLIEIGDRVTFAPQVYILAHDASTKRELGYTAIAPVKIGSDVFIGARTMILPGTTIGDKVVIGAGSVVSRNIPSNSVAVGNPAHVICSYDEYIEKRKKQMESCPCYDSDYTIGKITEEKRLQMCKDLSISGKGFVI